MRSREDYRLGLPELHTHSFIIKVWLEEPAEAADLAVWRGHITHVPSGERRYLKNPNEIIDFIVPYLEAMGVKLGMRWRMKQWLKGWKLRLTRPG